MKKSRKLAWCVLGVVVLGSLVLLVQLSSLYSRWRPHGFNLVCVSPPGSKPCYFMVRHQRYPWLPGRDLDLRDLTKDEFAALSREDSSK